MNTTFIFFALAGLIGLPVLLLATPVAKHVGFALRDMSLAGQSLVFANSAEMTILPAFAPGSGVPGTIAFANEGRFESAFYDEALTQYTVGGWDRDPLQELLEFLAPAVTVPERFNYKAGDALDYFLRTEGNEDVRPMGGDFGRLGTSRMTDVHDMLDEKGFVITLDRRELEADPTFEQRETMRALRVLLRNETRRAQALIHATSVNAAKTWNAAADPDQDVADELLIAEDATGLRPTRVAYGSTAWSKRSRAARGGDKAGDFASSNWTPDQVGQFLNVEAINTGDVRYRTTSGLASTVGNLVYLFTAASGLSKDDPSNIKRFTANTNGQAVAIYRQEFARKVEITVAHKSKIKITSTLGVRRLTIS